ncbi:MAG: ribosome silencing factor [candidate division NC10 bacterium]|nr:ribosome silencing factor [candidate division NC10 bacterium]
MKPSGVPLAFREAVKGGLAIDATRTVEIAAEAASAVKPSYLAILDLRGLCAFTDYFLIVSAESSRQLSAIAGRVAEALDGAQIAMRHREGAGEAQWILLDYHDVVIHIFEDKTREFYDLERLWGDAPKRQLIG